MDRVDLEAKVKKLGEELEQCRVQLAGCGVAAMANTKDAIVRLRLSAGDYGWSASYSDVCDAVDREMRYREALERIASGKVDDCVKVAQEALAGPTW